MKEIIENNKASKIIEEEGIENESMSRKIIKMKTHQSEKSAYRNEK